MTLASLVSDYSNGTQINICVFVHETREHIGKGLFPSMQKNPQKGLKLTKHSSKICNSGYCMCHGEEKKKVVNTK